MSKPDHLKFAKANGWRKGKRFNPYRLAGLRGDYYWNFGDHAEHFWKDRRPVAIVAHNYPNDEPEKGAVYYGRSFTGTEPELTGISEDEFEGTTYGILQLARKASQFGLVTHVAPDGAASD
jgi:hypothetical protein